MLRVNLQEMLETISQLVYSGEFHGPTNLSTTIRFTLASQGVVWEGNVVTDVPATCPTPQVPENNKHKEIICT